MAKQKYTLTSYDPVYVVAEEVRIPEEVVREQALRFLQATAAKPGEQAKLNDKWIASHCDDFNTVEEVMIIVRYNLYKDNREVQELADQNVVCAEISKRLVEELPADLVEDSLYAANYRLEEMVSRNGMSLAEFAKSRNMTEDELRKDIEERTIQSLREDSALQAYADHFELTLEAEDFYAIIPGENIQEKAYKRQQIELEGRLAQMEEYARKTKALKMIMEDARIKRRATDEEWLRYGDTAADVLNANKQFPENFVTAF